jgi:hypothetical protein
MDFKTIIEIIKNVVEIIAIVLAGIVGLRINWKFVPIIHLDILSEWLDQNNGKLKLKLSIENKSNVKAVKNSFRLQILEYNIDQITSLSEYVPFYNDKILETEKPNSWREPIHVWQPTEAIYPGQTTSLDYMCICPPNKLLHVALLFEGRPDFLSKLINLSESWCATKIFANSISNPLP